MAFLYLIYIIDSLNRYIKNALVGRSNECMYVTVMIGEDNARCLSCNRREGDGLAYFLDSNDVSWLEVIAAQLWFSTWEG